MHFRNLCPALLGLLVFIASCSEQKPQRALIFASQKDDNFTVEAMMAIKNLKVNDILMDTTTNLGLLQEDSLKKYGALVFVNTPVDPLDIRQQNDIERFVQAGGGLAVIHPAGFSKYQWPWFNRALAVIEINTDSVTGITTPLVTADDDEVPTADLPGEWAMRDRLYSVRLDGEASILVTTADKRPVSWIANSEAGNVFATIAGGTAQSFEDANFQKHLIGGIKYVLKGNKLDFKKATTSRVPEENRFLQLVLDTYLDEPIEMEIMDNGNVIFIERHGKVKLYDHVKKQTKVIASLQVQLEGNYEDGLLGMELDPGFSKNHFVYLYYSPRGGEPVQRLSRFKMEGDSLLLNSETVVMKVPVQRETCCHSAGNVYFGPDENLYLSTGDNTSSKESDGFTPIDERPGRAPFDAQKSSANTHDLRGKILRIHVEEDGSYTIPDGNLFPKDGSQGKPEIYVMGARNPYRLTVDKRGFLYWGDVGPDGGEDSDRGPMSYDEWNQARKPGYFGWPYFVADNKAYADFDFEKNTIGPRFDPNNVVNESPNNFGSKNLPPAQPAMIWYPYNRSKDFPMLSTGSRSAMAGPFYYYDEYKSDVKLPRYYDNKMFIFEWARNWVKVLTFSEEGDLQQIESFLPGFSFWHPIDVKFGKDGAMYVLQYGSNYFARNPDAQLVRIEYAEGNRQPVAQISAEKTVGAAPLTVKLSAKSSYDYDADTRLAYAWTSGNGKNSSEEEPTFTYAEPGIYKPTLTVTDDKGSSSVSAIEIKVGNETPIVNIKLKENSSFYFNNSVLTYKVDASDKEDGQLNQGINAKDVKFTVDYIKEGKDLALLSSYGTAAVSAKFIKGKSLMDASDCKSCHSMDVKSVGPTWLEVSQRYKNQGNVTPELVEKIIKGGNGNWGHAMMAAHPQLSEGDTREMVDYILSLANEQAGLPLQGTYKLTEHNGKGDRGSYVVTASYTDKGHELTGALTGRERFILRHPKIQAEDFDTFRNVGQQRPVGSDLAYVSEIKDGSYISFRNIDLTDISEIEFYANANNGRIEIRSNSPEGELLGTADLTGTATGWPYPWRTVAAKVKNPGGRNELFFVFKNDVVKNRNFAGLDWIFFKK